MYQPNGPFWSGGCRPVEMTCFPTVAGLTNAELQSLLEDDVKLEEMVHESPDVKSSAALAESLSVKLSAACEGNLAFRPVLETQQQRLRSLHTNLDAARAQFAANKARLDKLASKRTPDTILALLQSAMMEAEETAEKTANKLLAGKISSDEFVDRFLRERRLAHERRIKAEKLSDLIRCGATARPNPAMPSQAPYDSSATSRPRAPGSGYNSPHMR